MPVLDEAEGIIAALQALGPYRRDGVELIVVDGGSRDRTIELARPHADQMIAAPRGRASQMNAGAAAASGDVLLFLHADTRLPEHADQVIQDGLTRTGRDWGRFDVTISGESPLLPMIALAMNLRSWLTSIATGDQAMFMTRAAFDKVGGFADIALMEDIAMSRALKRLSRPFSLRQKVATSGRRWEKHGVLRTILLMWRLRLAYYFGAAPQALARRYGHVPR